jgi:hypothetical protein
MNKKTTLALIIAFVFLFASVIGINVTCAADDNGLVAHWTFDGNLNDSTANANNGTQYGNITYSDAILGQGAIFDGKSYIEVKDSASLGLQNTFTFSVWVYKDEYANRGDAIPYFAKQKISGATYPYALYEWWYLKPTVAFPDQRSANSGRPVDLQKWTLITTTYDGTTARIYLNKDLVTTQQVPIAPSVQQSPLYIGFTNLKNKDTYFYGKMDDLRIYNRAITQTEVESLFSAGLSGSGKDLLVKPNKLVARYGFDENYNDLSEFKNDGTLTGSSDSVSFTWGALGKAAKFTGNSLLEVKDNDSLDIDKAFTISSWILKDKVEFNPIIYKYGSSLGSNPEDSCYSLVDQGPVWMNTSDISENNKGVYNLGTEKVVQGGIWYFYTATFDGKTVRTYINGDVRRTLDFPGIVSHSTGPLYIAGDMKSRFLKGQLDDLRISNYALTSDEVKSLYNFKDSLIVKNATAISSLKAKQSLSIIVTRKSVETGALTDVSKQVKILSSNSGAVKISGTKLIRTGKAKATVTIINGAITTTINIKAIK